MSKLEQAISIAVKVHKGQVDKAGNPYIHHCYRVMSKMNTEEEKIVAILHDTIEDNNLTLFELGNYEFSNEVLEAIHLLTKTSKTPYDIYIKNIKTNTLATKVKIADLLDNINLSRLSSINVKDISRTRKYLDALEYLMV